MKNPTYLKAPGLVAAGVFILLASSQQSGAAETGKASWYAMTSKTASGEWADPNTMTAAHRTLKFGTKIKVTNLRNNRAVVLCVNDRGPFVKNRIVDVTKLAAARLGFLQDGWTHVRLERLGRNSSKCT